MKITSIKDVYKETINETDKIVNILEQKVDSDELSSAIETAKEAFRTLKMEADESLLALDKSAEWDALTIAFYGETNAGKSTIIETIRILLGEKTKKEQRTKFSEIKSKFDINSNTSIKLLEIKGEIKNEEKTKDEIKEKLDQEKIEHENEKQKHITRIESLKLEAYSLPLWKKMLSKIIKNKEVIAIEKAQKELDTIVLMQEKACSERGSELKKAEDKISSLQKTIEEINEAYQSLVSYQDGCIIGDGQSDFTREAVRYDFEVDGHKFILLDVPGIEGKESLVLKPIMEALRKAHIVFYVTRKPEPPQKGDEKNGEKGTLEKIREHLGAQAEVQVIYNKSIKSIEQVKIKELVSDGELQSIQVLEREMTKQLGEHFTGTKIISAYLAFISSTDHFVPETTMFKDRIKFTSEMKPSEFFNKSGFRTLMKSISSEMIMNTKNKIIKSNFNKANDTVIKLMSKLKYLNEITFIPLLDNLEEQMNDSISQLDNAVNELRNDLLSSIERLIISEKTDLINHVYNRIENGLSNGDFKVILEGRINKSVSQIQDIAPQLIEKNLVEFEASIADIAEQFQEHVAGFINDASKVSTMRLNVDINLDTGISYAGLAGTALGTIGLIFVTGGWALVIGAIGVVVSLAKAIYSWFDTDFKKEQQRGSADENIDQALSQVESSYSSLIDENLSKIDELIGSIKTNFMSPAEQTRKIKQAIDDSIGILGNISTTIVKEGVLK